MLHLKGLKYSTVEEPLRVWTDWMKEWSSRTGERARVPILRIVDDDGAEKVYSESNDINFMLDRKYGNISYTPARKPEAYKEMNDWHIWCADTLKPQIDLFKYGENLQLDPLTHTDHTKILRDMLQKLEKALAGKRYLLEDRLTVTDIAIIPFIRQIMRTREGEFEFTEFPSTLAWTLSLIETSWFKDIIMKKDPSSRVQ
jgi:glutathione S-transferase